MNGILTQLTDDSGLNSQSGTFAFDVNEGDIFGFAIETLDNTQGSARATISNFKAPGVPQPEPQPVPEPASLLGLVAVGSLGVALKRRQQLTPARFAPSESYRS